MTRNLFIRIFITLSLISIASCKHKPKEQCKPIEEITIPELQTCYNEGTRTVSEVVAYYIEQIKTMDWDGPELHSVIMINPDAVDIAAKLDEELKNGHSRGPLHGIPVLLKDNIDTHDMMETTGGSRALLGSYPLKDSWVAAKLREAGAVILGKTNLSEWANFRSFSSSSGWSGVGGQTKNPYVLTQNPCGSSSGSGVAVSANFCMLAIGTETNGSIVCPSGANGIVGIKPTVGLISRSGIIPISFTQDTPGPMARTVTDAAICLGALTGTDTTDSKTLNSKDLSLSDYTPFLNPKGLKGKRIAVYTGPTGILPEVDSLFKLAINDMKAAGAELVTDFKTVYDTLALDYSFDVLLYEFKDGINSYLASLGDEAPVKTLADIIAFNKGDSLELKYFDQKILEMAEDKGDLNSPEYLEALNKMKEMSTTEGIDKLMDEYDLDAIIAPTGSPAWRTDLENGDSFVLSSSSPAAMAGYPNITLPMGFVNNLPVGISIFGRAWSEPVLIEIAFGYEQKTKHRKVPKFLN
ncbi:amidase [Saccharicrinis sp. FJH54]|uniref:amidase n=1 Tax=Saccharicrinis sp. FJH54 TaxID=3344665 RepID=UPI0035D3DCE0